MFRIKTFCEEHTKKWFIVKGAKKDLCMKCEALQLLAEQSSGFHFSETKGKRIMIIRSYLQPHPQASSSLPQYGRIEVKRRKP